MVEISEAWKRWVEDTLVDYRTWKNWLLGTAFGIGAVLGFFSHELISHLTLR
jgi:hypothetical protein